MINSLQDSPYPSSPCYAKYSIFYSSCLLSTDTKTWSRSVTISHCLSYNQCVLWLSFFKSFFFIMWLRNLDRLFLFPCTKCSFFPIFIKDFFLTPCSVNDILSTPLSKETTVLSVLHFICERFIRHSLHYKKKNISYQLRTLTPISNENFRFLMCLTPQRHLTLFQFDLAPLCSIWRHVSTLN